MDEVKQLVETLQKHSKFKQLATYSLQSLCKKCGPPSSGWQESVRSAYTFNSASVVATVLAKNSTDIEVFGLCLSHLQAGASTGLGASLFRNGVIALVIESFAEFMISVDLPPCRVSVSDGLISPSGGYKAGPALGAVGVFESFCRFVLCLVSQSRSDTAANEGLRKCIFVLLQRAPSPAIKRLVVQALAAIAGVPAALMAFTNELDGLITMLTEVYNPTETSLVKACVVASPVSRVATRATVAASPVQKKLGAAGNVASSGNSYSAWNGHIHPGFEIFDAISRTDHGLMSLRGCAGTMTVFAHAVDFAQVCVVRACD
jgi:hypothetical protein